MGFTEFLTLLFITLKLTDVVDWSWWAVLSPELIALAIYLIVAGAVLTFGRGVVRKVFK